jgi:hypothetical protein
MTYHNIRRLPPAGDDRVRGVSRSYKALVCQRAVMGRVAGGRTPHPRIAAEAQKLRRRWRGLVSALATLGWPKATEPSRRVAMLRCNPACYIPMEQGRNCEVAIACPDCWARQAMESWAIIDALLFPVEDAAPPVTTAPALTSSTTQAPNLDPGSRPDARSRPRRRDDLVLVERLVTYSYALSAVANKTGKHCRTLAPVLRYRLKPWKTASEVVPPKPGPERFLPREKEIRQLRNVGIVGGLDVTRVELSRPKAKPPRWRVLVHQLLLLPAASAERILANPRVAAAALMCGSKPRVRLRVTRGPARRHLVAAVSRAFRYPGFLIGGQPELALEYLKARSGLRLSTRFGVLQARNKPRRTSRGSALAPSPSP